VENNNGLTRYAISSSPSILGDIFLPQRLIRAFFVQRTMANIGEITSGLKNIEVRVLVVDAPTIFSLALLMGRAVSLQR
jgi:hypothetical protein